MYRIAWFSPLFDSDSESYRSAAFSRAVLRHLPTTWDVVLFVDDEDWSRCERSRGNSRRCWNREVRNFHEAARVHREAAFDFAVFQLEDSGKCFFVQRQLRLWPGLVYFHDLQLNSLYRSYFAHSTGGTDLNAMMRKEFGPDAPRVGDWHVRGWRPEVFDTWYACGQTEWDSSAVRVVFCEADLHRVSEASPGVPTHLALPLTAAADQHAKTPAESNELPAAKAEQVSAALDLQYLVEHYAERLRARLLSREQELRQFTKTELEGLKRELSNTPTWTLPSGDEAELSQIILDRAIRDFHWLDE